MAKPNDELQCFPQRIGFKVSESRINGRVEYAILGLADINTTVFVTTGLDFPILASFEVHPPFRDPAIRDLCLFHAKTILIERLNGLLQKERYPSWKYKTVCVDEKPAGFVEFPVFGLSDLPEEDSVIRINSPSTHVSRNIFRARLHLLIGQLDP